MTGREAGAVPVVAVPVAALPVVAVGGVVLAPGPRVLLVQRGAPPMAGQWSLPGGRLRAGETIAQGVEREVLEETGIDVAVGALVEVVEILTEGYHYVVHDHLCVPVDPSAVPRAASDATHVRYARPNELAQIGASEAVTRVVRKAIAMRQAESEDE